jgi:hypothetical protein
MSSSVQVIGHRPVLKLVLSISIAALVAAWLGLKFFGVPISGSINRNTVTLVHSSLALGLNKFRLSSAGGSSEAGLQIAEAIQNKGVTVVVEDYCLSSCANYLFLFAHRRILQNESVVGFHHCDLTLNEFVETQGLKSSNRSLARAQKLRNLQTDFGSSPDVIGFLRLAFARVVPLTAAPDDCSSLDEKTGQHKECGAYVVTKHALWLPKRTDFETFGIDVEIRNIDYDDAPKLVRRIACGSFPKRSDKSGLRIVFGAEALEVPEDNRKC